MSTEPASPLQQDYLSAKRPLIIGYLATFALVFGLGMWSVFASISGAVVASGVVELESNQQVIQHPSGGVVGEILARDGDAVKAGQTLIKLDPSLIEADYVTVNNALFELLAKKFRLVAERDGKDAVTYPNDLVEQARAELTLALQLSGQKQLFNAGEESFSKEVAQLGEQKKQLNNQIIGIQAKINSLDQQSRVIAKELKKKRALLKRQLVTSTTISELELRKSDLDGSRSKFEADIAQIKGQIISGGIEITRLQSQKKQKAIAELREIEPRIVELTQRRVKLQNQLDRLDIKSPVAGVVHGSKVQSLQSVIQAAEPLMYVVPQEEPMIIKVKVDAADRSQIELEQEVALKFPAFSQRNLPDVMGNVKKISANVYSDEATQSSYYSVEVSPKASEMQKLEGRTLLPGMPVEAFLKTRERSPLSFLTSPLMDYFDRSFRGR